jgi:hypothetical protein
MSVQRFVTWSLLASSFAVTAACSSAEDGNAAVDPRGGSGNATGGTSGAASGGDGGMTAGGAGGTSGSAGSSGSAGTGGAICAEECPSGGFCLMGECKCPADAPDICDATCVSLDNDAEHCGDCETACDAGAACSMGVCGPAPTELTSGDGCGVIRLALSGTDLYWTEAESGKVRTLPIAGGTASDVASGQLEPLSIAADDEGVYWANQGDGSADSSTVMKKAFPLDADPAVTLATGTAGEGESPVILAIAVADATLYYTLVHDVHAISTDESVTDDVIVGTATNLDNGGGAEGFPSGLALDDTYVSWTTGQRSGVERDDRDEGDDAYLELGESQADLLLPDIASDGTSAYWASGERIVMSLLVREPADGNTTLVTTPDFHKITALTIDATNVYFANDAGFVFKAPLAGGDAVAIARDQSEPTSLIVDGTTLVIATADCAIRTLSLE